MKYYERKAEKLLIYEMGEWYLAINGRQLTSSAAVKDRDDRIWEGEHTHYIYIYSMEWEWEWEWMKDKYRILIMEE